MLKLGKWFWALSGVPIKQAAANNTIKQRTLMGCESGKYIGVLGLKA
jgi:hypothetical protein